MNRAQSSSETPLLPRLGVVHSVKLREGTRRGYGVLKTSDDSSSSRPAPSSSDNDYLNTRALAMAAILDLPAVLSSFQQGKDSRGDQRRVSHRIADAQPLRLCSGVRYFPSARRCTLSALQESVPAPRAHMIRRCVRR
ncbi:hypothetical protein PsYK624_101860 [Phanerochaete sordida]|uniref:Uncharacterized protein n=1 Tax=Phanerochaete sordida TaxID=48140 RepID=A0A9P3LGP3_9APHY|nr:hypothetical protein PsYK624_101860 [Phanerochaete sordida]